MRAPADLPDRDAAFYRRYLQTCAAIGVTPSSFERVAQFAGEWNRRIVGGQDGAQRTH